MNRHNIFQSGPKTENKHCPAKYSPEMLRSWDTKSHFDYTQLIHVGSDWPVMFYLMKYANMVPWCHNDIGNTFRIMAVCEGWLVDSPHKRAVMTMVERKLFKDMTTGWKVCPLLIHNVCGE